MPRQTTFKATVRLDRFAERQQGTSQFHGKEMSLSQSCAYRKSLGLPYVKMLSVIQMKKLANFQLKRY